MAAGVWRKVLKWAGLGVSAVVVLIVLAFGYFYIASSKIMNRQIALPATRPLPVRTDSAAVARGEHLSEVMLGCGDCHGRNYGGAPFFNDPAFGRLFGPNITRGKGGKLASYTITDLEHILRHGVRQDGKPSWIMPAHHFCYITDDDVAAIWAYLQTLKPVDQDEPPRTLGPIGRMLLAQGKLPLEPEPIINHEARLAPHPPEGPTAEYGQYLARISCMGCHGPNFSGGPIMGAPPEWTPAANLTRGGIGAQYKEEDFFRALREGVRPGGAKLDTTMPVKMLKHLTDDEIHALWAYLQSAPPAAYASGDWTKIRVP